MTIKDDVTRRGRIVEIRCHDVEEAEITVQYLRRMEGVMDRSQLTLEDIVEGLEKSHKRSKAETDFLNRLARQKRPSGVS